MTSYFISFFLEYLIRKIVRRGSDMEMDMDTIESIPLFGNEHREALENYKGMRRTSHIKSYLCLIVSIFCTAL